MFFRSLHRAALCAMGALSMLCVTGPAHAAQAKPRPSPAAASVEAAAISLPRLREDAAGKKAMVSIVIDAYAGGAKSPLTTFSLMQKYKITGTVMLTTDSASDPASSWDTIAKWVDAGWSVGSRAVADVDLSGATDDAVVAALAGSAALITKHTGMYPAAFAPPGGKANASITAAARKFYDGMMVSRDAGSDEPMAGFNDIASVDHYAVSRVMLTKNTPASLVCDDVAWAAKDRRWLVIGIGEMSPDEPSDKLGWYQVSPQTLDLILDCVANYRKNGDIGVVAFEEGLRAVPAAVATADAAK
jgi:hypothetical protein